MKKCELAVPATLEAQELRELERRTDLRLAQQRAQRAEQKVARMKKERMELAAFVMIISLAVAASVCIAAAPWWTAVFPFVGALAVMRKVGWL